MTDVDLEGLSQRQPRLKQKKEKGTFNSVGPNWVVFLDSHDKLMGFQKSTFPANTPRGFHVETTRKRPFPRRFNVEST